MLERVAIGPLAILNTSSIVAIDFRVTLFQFCQLGCLSPIIDTKLWVVMKIPNLLSRGARQYAFEKGEGENSLLGNVFIPCKASRWAAR